MTPDTQTLADEARHVAAAHRLQDHNGLADLLDDLAAALDAKDAEIQRLREALEEIGNEPHADTCDFLLSDYPCDCFRAIARAALSRSDTPGENDG